MHLAGSPLDTVDEKAIPGRFQIRVVADVHDRHQKSEFARHLATHGAQPPQQAALAILADKTDETVADLDLQWLDQLDHTDVDFGRFGSRRRWWRRLRSAILLAPDPPGGPAHQPGEKQERQMRHAGNEAEQSDDPRSKPPRLRKDRELRDDLVADIGAGRHPADNDTGR